MDKKQNDSRNHLNQDELIAYYNGNLSNREMHRLEVHLLDCQLCSEALEGLAFTNERDFVAHINKIKQKTNTAKESGLSQKQWLAIAASISIIAILSWTLLNLSDHKTETLADNSVKEDSVTEIAHEDLARAKVAVSGEKDSITANSSSATKLLAAEPIADKPVKSVPPAVIAQPVTEVVANKLVVETITEPSLAESKQPQIIDSITGLPTEDELMANTKTAAGQAAVTKVDSAPAEVSSLQEASSANAKKSAAPDFESAQPSKGMRTYTRYLKSKLNYPTAAKENSIEGEVILEVTINTAGEIGNINVIQSLGFGCDEEAIRLIKEGATWQPATSNGSPVVDKVKISVPFNL